MDNIVYIIASTEKSRRDQHFGKRRPKAPLFSLIHPMMISRGRSPENGKSRGTPEAMKKRRAAHEFFHLCGLTMAYVLRSFRPHVLFLTSLGITRRTNSAKFFQTRACSHVSRDLTTARLYHQSRAWREPIPVWVHISAEAVRSLAHTYCL